MLRHYPAYEYYLAAAQLMLAMLGMGATLSVSDFAKLLRAPQGVLVSLAAQWLLTPALAVALTRLLNLPAGIAVGMVVVAAMPSGSLSNVFTHLARGNGALSIAITTVSTLACLATTPLVLRVFAAADLPADFHMPVARVMFEIGVCLLLPLAVGMLVGRYAGRFRIPFSKWSLRGSLLVLLAIVVGALGSGRLDLKAFGWLSPAAIVLFGGLSYLAVLAMARIVRLAAADVQTAGLTVLLRNCNLAVLIKASLFPATSADDQVAGGVLFAALFYGGATLLLAAATVAIHRTRK